MKKKLISLLLVLALVVGICPVAMAGKVFEENPQNQEIREGFLTDDGLDDAALQEVLAEYNTLTKAEAEEYIVPFEIVDKYYAMTEAEEEALNTMLSSSEESDEENVNYARAARSIVGPYTDITTMPASFVTIMLAYLESHQGAMIDASTNYNGTECYVFTSGSIDVYVAASAFYTAKNSVYPSASTVSSTLTTYMNNQNTNPVYSTRMVSTRSQSDTYLCKITQVSSQASRTSDVSVFANTTFEKSIYLEANYNFITVYNTGTVALQPTLTLEITDAGTAKTYFGGLDVSGLGTTTSTVNIASLINLGYNLGLTFSGSFSVATFATLIGTTVSLAKEKSGSDYRYTASTQQLSNPAENKYTRKCSMQAPFTLKRSSTYNYYQMKIGLMNADKNAKYKVTVSYTFS